MSKITPESTAELKSLFNDNNKATSANFSQLIDFFNDNKVTDNGDGTFTVNGVIVKLSDLATTDNIDYVIAQKDLATQKYVDDEVSKIPQPDLSNYATQQQLATKADTSSIDPSVMAKTTLTADDDVLALDAGTYYTWGIAPHNFPENLSAWATIVVKEIANHGTDGKSVTITDTGCSQLVNSYTGNPDSWSGWQVLNSTTMASKTDVTTAISTATANIPGWSLNSDEDSAKTASATDSNIHYTTS